ncbi:MAG: phosphoribosylglycinamide formyltransferase [Blastopirellula sp.]|nr:MAG: phosphoribosylglycinamide formyltransferase [Blastopirellula sp.]
MPTHSAENRLKVAVMISGGGTTLKNLLAAIARDQLWIEVVGVVSSSAKAGGIRYAEEAGIPFSIIRPIDFNSTEAFSSAIFSQLRETQAELTVMGGFLKHVLIPADFENKVVNIHPALIPAFCGKGYYGSRVHQAAIDYGVKISGCTIHFVDDDYDHGPIIDQAVVPVEVNDTASTLAARVFEAECDLYPKTLQAFAEGRVEINGRTIAIHRTPN